MQKFWRIKNIGNAEILNNLIEGLGVSFPIANLLFQRKIESVDDAKRFFTPSLDDLHDPFLMQDMDKAVARLQKAIENNESILIYGDYDVDGTTSVALVYSFLRERYNRLGYYVPNRYEEGYGISFKGIDYAHENNFSLVIALDCGIKGAEKIRYASQKNIDFIICDHHTVGDEIPQAAAVLDPKRNDCAYPFKELSGCGVGFKFLQGFCLRNGIQFRNLEPFLDLVCVSIASDIVPIIGENRTLAYFGLKKLNESACTGLKSIIKIAGIENAKIVISDCVFKIGPRINAAGRIESGKKAVELLVSDNEDIAREVGENINDFNIIRKKLDSQITLEALEMITSSQELLNNKSTVLFKPGWHKGVIGIVASRLIESYYRPTVILTEAHGYATGSARSVDGFNLYNAIDACSDLLEGFGGHMYAAGLTLKIENVEKFAKRFEEVVKNTIQPEQCLPLVDIDGELMFEDINTKMFEILKQFEPYGPENMTPVFISKRVRDTGNSKIVGTSGEHVKMELIQADRIMTGIAFSQAENIDLIKSGEEFDIVFTLYENEFRGNTHLELMIREIRRSEQHKFIVSLKNALSTELPGYDVQKQMMPLNAYPVTKPSPPDNAKPSAILILIYRRNDKWVFPLIKRAAKVGDQHSAQISFPGGAYEEKDNNLLNTALREAQEEIGVDASKVQIVGKLSPLYIHVSNFLVQPFVGYLPVTPRFYYDFSEVQYMIEAELSSLSCLNEIPQTQFTRGTNFVTAPFYPVGDEKVWGATAMILREFLEICRPLF